MTCKMSTDQMPPGASTGLCKVQEEGEQTPDSFPALPSHNESLLAWRLREDFTEIEVCIADPPDLIGVS